MSNPTTNDAPPASATGRTADVAAEVTSSATSAAGAVTDTAKQEVGDVASTAADQARAVAAQATEQARNVMADAGVSVRSALRQTTEQARAQAEDRTRMAAEGIRSTSEQLQALAEGRPQEAGPMADYTRQAAEKLSQLAGRMEQGGIEGLAGDVAGFARRRPGLFLAGGAAAGFLIGRLLRNQGAGSTSDTRAEPPQSPLPAPAAPARALEPSIASPPYDRPDGESSVVAP